MERIPLPPARRPASRATLPHTPTPALPAAPEAPVRPAASDATVPQRAEPGAAPILRRLQRLALPTAPDLTIGGRALHRRIQRHTLRFPDALKPTQILAPKVQWSIEGPVNRLVTDIEIDNIRTAVAAVIPPTAVPPPLTRANAVVVHTVDTAGMPPGYQNAPAKADAAGHVWINWEYPDYFRADGSADVDRVKTTLVHEFMHAVSAPHAANPGLQGYADLLNPNAGPAASYHQPDEAVTELLATRVYDAVFGGATPYVTGYVTPAPTNVYASVDADKKKLASQQQLPATWTGDMVEILENVLGINEAQLIAMYFENPGAFGTQINNTPNAKQEIIKRWNARLGRDTLERHDIVASDYREQLLLDMVSVPVARKLLSAPDEAAQVRTVQYAARDFGAPVHTTPGLIGPQQMTFTDAYIKGNSPAGGRRLANILNRAAQVIAAAPPGGGPTLDVAFPREQELITNPNYTVRCNVSADVNNVRVNIGGRGWQQARRADDGWYYDTDLSQYGQGPVEILCEAWTDQGNRVEVSRRIQFGQAQPPAESPPIDTALVERHLRTLNVNVPVKIVAVPKSIPQPGGPANARLTFRLNTPLSQYPPGYTYGLSGADLPRSLGDLLHIPAGNLNEPAFPYVEQGFQGAGYDRENKMVVMNADHNSSRALLHELGHFKQDLEGGDETNTYIYVLEYHNILLHENLDPGELRTSYGAVPPNPHGRTWADLRHDVRDYPTSTRLLDEIDAALATPKYAAIAQAIRANLVAEHYGDQKGDRAVKKIPVLTIDYPTENQNVPNGHYAIRITAAARVDSVNIRLNQGPWQHARATAGYWWLDIDGAQLAPGANTITAEAWVPDGARRELTRAVQHA